jgi:hypothetical protein
LLNVGGKQKSEVEKQPYQYRNNKGIVGIWKLYVPPKTSAKKVIIKPVFFSQSP